MPATSRHRWRTKVRLVTRGRHRGGRVAIQNNQTEKGMGTNSDIQTRSDLAAFLFARLATFSPWPPELAPVTEMAKDTAFFREEWGFGRPSGKKVFPTSWSSDRISPPKTNIGPCLPVAPAILIPPPSAISARLPRRQVSTCNGVFSRTRSWGYARARQVRETIPATTSATAPSSPRHATSCACKSKSFGRASSWSLACRRRACSPRSPPTWPAGKASSSTNSMHAGCRFGKRCGLATSPRRASCCCIRRIGTRTCVFGRSANMPAATLNLPYCGTRSRARCRQDGTGAAGRVDGTARSPAAAGPGAVAAGAGAARPAPTNRVLSH
jgi:hypothetical protein